MASYSSYSDSNPAMNHGTLRNPRVFLSKSAAAASAANNKIVKLSRHFVNSVSKLSFRLEKALHNQNHGRNLARNGALKGHSNLCFHNNNVDICDLNVNLKSNMNQMNSGSNVSLLRSNSNVLNNTRRMSGEMTQVQVNLGSRNVLGLALEPSRAFKKRNLRTLEEFDDDDDDMLELTPIPLLSHAASSSSSSNFTHNNSVSTLPIVSPRWSRASSLISSSGNAGSPGGSSRDLHKDQDSEEEEVAEEEKKPFSPLSQLAVTLLEEEAELSQAPWFQAGIPREIALEVLRSEPVGSFIVRESTTKSGCFALSLRVPRDFQPSGIAHYLILLTGRGYKIKGFTKEFGSLSALITHHSVMPELLPCTLSLSRYRPTTLLRPSRLNSPDFVEPEKLIPYNPPTSTPNQNSHPPKLTTDF